VTLSVSPFEKSLPAPAALSDEEVIARIVAGEKALFEVLMRRYNQRVYRAVRAVLHDDTEAEEVMQQAYINAYTHLHQFAERARFSTWLTRIAVNEAIARRRKLRSPLRATSDTEDTMNDFAAAGPSPEQEAITTDLRATLEAVIGHLPENYRSVFVLREVEGMSTSETADALSVSDDVVKTRLHRAKLMLREALFQRVGATLENVFPFHATRCDRVVKAVLDQI
jgi:RNA polymerase sigma-70 factor (ECF subfamily)